MVINHSFHSLADIQLVNVIAYWVVIIWIFEVFSLLDNSYDGGFFPGGGGGAPVSQILLTLLLLTPDISGATYLACVTNTGYIRSLGTLALGKIKTTYVD